MLTSIRVLIVILIICNSCYSLSASMTIHFFQPEWQQATLSYRENPNQPFASTSMRRESANWWQTKIKASTIEFSFLNGNDQIDLGKVLGCYENNHYDCSNDELDSKSFRNSSTEIWVKNGLLFISDPDLKISKNDIGVFTVLSLNLHTYQEVISNKKNSEPITKEHVQQLVLDHSDIFGQIAKAIDQLDPDAICFQEVGEWVGLSGADDFGINETNAVKQILKRLKQNHYKAYMDWSHYGWDIWKEGSAILSKYPIIEESSQYISQKRSIQKRFWKSRNIPRIKIDVPEIGKINLFSVHSGWWNDEDEPFSRQFERLTNWVDKVTEENETTILCGDFNQPANSKGYQLMVSDAEYKDVYLAANPYGMYDSTIGGKIAGWETINRGQRVDYLLLNKTWQLKVVQSQRIFTEKSFGRVSDHVGIYAQFKKQ